MDLPVQPPLRPMLAKATSELPERDDILFEPKWDGFRCIVFRSGDDVLLGSRNERPLTRYFPELVDPIRAQFPERCVVDAELVIAAGHKLDFEALQQRIHPAKSRITMLAEKTPASLVAFDLIALDTRDLRTEPFSARRSLLAESLSNVDAPIYLTPTTASRAVAARWFRDFEGAGLDGLLAKPINDPYKENKRSQIKVKHVRSADAVVAGFRWHKDGQGIGSLLLGLWDENGNLRHVGVAASFTKKRRAELVEELRPLTEHGWENHPWRPLIEHGEVEPPNTAKPSSSTITRPGPPNRWNANKNQSWVPVRIRKVAEVKYSTTLNGRFRDVTKMLRWRPDKAPKDCDYHQLQEPTPYDLAEVLAADG